MKQMNYLAELEDFGIKEVIEPAVVFYRKKVWIKYDVKKALSGGYR